MLKGLIFGLDQVLVDSNQANPSPDREKYEMLMKLKACSLRLAVCAPQPKKTLDTLLMKTQIKNFFDLTLGIDHLPHISTKAELYLECLDILGLDIKECLIVETEDACLELEDFNTLSLANLSELNYSLITDMIKIQKISNSVIEILEGIGQIAAGSETLELKDQN